MTKEINNGQVRSSTRNGGLGLIFVLLLLALLAFSFWYPRDDGRTYGDVALLDAQNFKSKAINKTRGIYECATQGCKSKNTDLLANSVTPNETKVSEGTIDRPAAQEASVVTSSSSPPSSTTSSTTETSNLPVFHTNPILPPGVKNTAPYSNAASAAPLATGTPKPAQATPQGSQFPVTTASVQDLAGAAPMPDSPSAGQSFQSYPVFPSQQDPSPGTYRPQAKQFSAPPDRSTASDGVNAQPDKYLHAARQSIAQHRYREAIALYRKQLSENPGDIDAYGELGNLFMFTQRYPEAAQNYYEAATRLLDAGLPAAVRPLLPVIERYEPVLAKLLKQKAAQFDR